MIDKKKNLNLLRKNFEINNHQDVSRAFNVLHYKSYIEPFEKNKLTPVKKCYCTFYPRQ